MPSDFGDESGEKLVDWMMQVGQDMGDAAMQASANKLSEAFRNVRGDIGSTSVTALSDNGSQAQGREWARLDMHEFVELAGLGDGLPDGVAGAFEQLADLADAEPVP